MSSGPDIRKFFGSSKKEQPSSALAALRSTVRSSPKAKEVPKVSPKTMKPSVDAKKRSEKHTSKQQKEELLEILTDGESPIPKSKKTTLKSVKRKPTVLDSDDEEIIPRRAKASRPLSGTPSPSKKQSSRKKILISSESEASPSPRKKQQKKSAVVSSDDEEEPVKISSESDSEEEPLPQKSRKRMLPPGQKKLKLTAKTKSSVPETTPEASSDVGLEKVSAADYFGSSAKKVGKKKETPKKTREEFVELEETFTKKSKTSPRQRTPKKVVASVVEDEFLEEDDRVAEPVTIKKKENTLKRKDAIPKKTSRNREFNDSDDEIISKTNKISPSSKENQPKKPKRKEQEVKEKLLVKPPTFIAGTPASTAEREVKEYELPWVDKYKPKTTSQLVGQHGEKSPMNKLLGWLGDWAKNNLGEGGKTKKPKPAPFMSQADGTAFKAALLSGSPGVGKTTCAHMACESLGLKFVEMNASDVRNKKHLEAQIAQLTGSHQIEEYFGRTTNDSHEDTEIHHVLIMDEVDGMSGNEDRAGIAELIQMIKETKIPIICICNDRSHPKMRSLVNHCYDLRFPRPRVEQIRGRVMTIAAQEKVKITKDEVDELIELSAHDVRQVIYNLQMRSTAVKSKIEKKDCAINTFEAARKLLDSRSSIMEKQEMFFVDYGIMPLFVHENYLNMKNKTHSKAESLKCIREAADLISLGDTVDKCIRSTGAWKLLNEQAMFSAVMPTIATDGHMGSMIQFPSWLGKNSTAGKRQRLMRQLASHAHLKISADTHSLVTDYVPALRRALTDPLLRQENEGVPDVVATMTEYDLLKDDAEAIGELAVWPGKIDPASKIPSKVTTLTRALNKEHRILPYHLEDVTKGRRRAAATVEIEVDEDGNLVERVDGEEEEPEGDEEEETNPGVVKSSTSSRGKGAARAGRGARGKK